MYGGGLLPPLIDCAGVVTECGISYSFRTKLSLVGVTPRGYPV